MKIKILILLLIISAKSMANINSDPLTEAKKIALGTNKLILVDFYAEWCGPCKKMDTESWHREDISDISSNYIFVKVNIDSNVDIAKKYGVTSIPYIFILDSEGEIVHKNLGYLPKNRLKSMLEKYAINLQYLQTSYIINSKKETISSNIRLAQKQQEFSLYLEENVRRDFLSLSRKYLYKAENLSKKENNSAFNQKIDLLYLQGYLINGNIDKVRKKLKRDFKEEDIDEINESMYCFLNYMIADDENESEIAQNWLSKLKEHRGSKIYLKEIELLQI